MTANRSQSGWMAGVLMMALMPAVQAAGQSPTYPTAFRNGFPQAVYKSVDGSGRVTYSSTWSRESVKIDEVAIRPGPSQANRDQARERHEKIRDSALELQQAREQRQAERDEAEKRRLERLALQASARPQVYERRIVAGWFPVGWPHLHGRYHHKRPHGQGSHPLRSRSLSGYSRTPHRRLESIPLD